MDTLFVLRCGYDLFPGFSVLVEGDAALGIPCLPASGHLVLFPFSDWKSCRWMDGWVVWVSYLPSAFNWAEFCSSSPTGQWVYVE